MTPTPTIIPDPPDELIAPGWKIYRNLTAGYSINYPKNWYNRSEPKANTPRWFSNRNPEAEADPNLYMQKDEVLVSVEAGTEEDLFHAPAKLFEIKSGESSEQNFFIYTKRAAFLVDGLPAVKYNIAVSPNHPGTELIGPYDTFWAIKNGQTLVEIDALMWDKTRYDKYFQLIESMVASFRFIR